MGNTMNLSGWVNKYHWDGLDEYRAYTELFALIPNKTS